MEQAQLLLEAAHLPGQRRPGPVQPAGRKGTRFRPVEIDGRTMIGFGPA